MKAFADLLDRLSCTPQRLTKLAALQAYFRTRPDPERGYALAALTGDLSFREAKPHMFRSLVAERVDPVLFELSYDYVGDLAETIALIWPARPGANAAPELPEVVETLASEPKARLPEHIERWLDALDANGRWALIKLVTRGLRVGVSARLAKTAVAGLGGVEPNAVEEIWHGLLPPYSELFAWLDGHAPKPSPKIEAAFRPPMLATSFDEVDRTALDPSEFAAEWKWDGVRVQASREGDSRRLSSRTGDDISETFPDVLNALEAQAVIAGELLIARAHDGDGLSPAPFSELQKRLNRKVVDRKLLDRSPAFVRAYDLLWLDGEDLRSSPFRERRRRLEDLLATRPSARLDLSPLVPFSDWRALESLRAAPPDDAIEGVMLKRWDSVYTPGRPKGPWFKWKREPFTVDAVLLYAQRGHGKRSSFYSDYTFGVWTRRDGEDGLVPVGKAYFGFTDEELKLLDKFVREHTTDRFGPVRQVRADPDVGLVLEVAFEGLNRSPRHKSGVAMRFPRIKRIRWDKPPKEADRLESLEALLPRP